MNRADMMMAMSNADRTISEGSMNREATDIRDRLTGMGYATRVIKEAMEKLVLLQQLLADGVAHFQFQKQDRTRRDAFGTRSREVIENTGGDARDDGSKKKGKPAPGAVMAFYDIEKKDWRCFKPENLISVDTEYLTI